MSNKRNFKEHTVRKLANGVLSDQMQMSGVSYKKGAYLSVEQITATQKEREVFGIYLDDGMPPIINTDTHYIKRIFVSPENPNVQYEIAEYTVKEIKAKELNWLTEVDNINKGYSVTDFVFRVIVDIDVVRDDPSLSALKERLHGVVPFLVNKNNYEVYLTRLKEADGFTFDSESGLIEVAHPALTIDKLTDNIEVIEINSMNYIVEKNDL